MARTSVSGNASVGDRVDNEAKAQFVPVADEAMKDMYRDAQQAAADVRRDQGESERTIDAERAVPRTRKDNANPRMNRALPSPDAKRPMTSSRRKKDYSAHKQSWKKNMAGTRARAVRQVLENQQELERVNDALRRVVGNRNALPKWSHELVSRTDRAIQDYERTNEREHIVYATLLSPAASDTSRTRLRQNLERMARQEKAMTFDGYIPATHSMGNISDGQDIVMEIQTRSGAYLGTSDSTPDANHVIGRGRRLQPVNVFEAEYDKPDGTTGKRWVVQMRDVSEE